MNEIEKLLDSAMAALAAGRKETAQRLLSHVLTLEPTNQQAWLYMAVAVSPTQAVEALQRVLVLNPQHKVALRNLILLRRVPQATLDLADVLLEDDEHPLAAFGEEPPTIPLASLKRFAPKVKVYPESPFKQENISPSQNNEPVSLAELGISLTPPPTPKPQTFSPPTPLNGGSNWADSSNDNNHEATIVGATRKHNPEQNQPTANRMVSSYFDSDKVPSAPVRPVSYTPANALRSGNIQLKDRPVRRGRGPARPLTNLTFFGNLLLLVLLLLVLLSVYLVYFG